MEKIIEQQRINEVTPGAELGRDVLDNRGRLLMKSGTVMGSELLVKLKHRGVESIPVLQDISPEDVMVKREEIERKMENRFRKVADEPLMQQLRSILVTHRLDSLK